MERILHKRGFFYGSRGDPPFVTALVRKQIKSNVVTKDLFNIQHVTALLFQIGLTGAPFIVPIPDVRLPMSVKRRIARRRRHDGRRGLLRRLRRLERRMRTEKNQQQHDRYDQDRDQRNDGTERTFSGRMYRLAFFRVPICFGNRIKFCRTKNTILCLCGNRFTARGTLFLCHTGTSYLLP